MQPGSDFITVKRDEDREEQCARFTPIRDLFPQQCAKTGLHVLGARVNNDAVSLSYLLEVDSEIKPITMADSHGWRIYRRSLAFLLAKAVQALFPEAFFAVEHSLGSGLYCRFEQNGDHGIDPDQVEHLERYLREQVEQDLPIVRRKISFEKAMAQFEQTGQTDKYNLLRFQNPPKIEIHDCDGFRDLAHGPMADRTSALGHFRLIPYPPGMVLQFPDRENPPQMVPFKKQPHLFDIFQEHKQWGRILGIQTIGQLNETIFEKKAHELIKIAEAFHEKKIAHIADKIEEKKDRVTWVLIAGPSSAGKTTFAKRLRVQLRVCGLRPETISVDDYFVNRDDTPLNDDGSYDFEHVETIDLALLNEHLEKLDRGQEVELPSFNFETGRREYKGRTLRLEEDQMVIMEGIHCLNPKLTETIPNTHKYRVYISALTQLNLDFNNRLSTTDNRLLRRMIRDNQFRGNDALATLNMWPSVRRGEKKWIFPYQKHADMAFNSALDYEWAVLRPFAEPLLAEIKPRHEQYAESRRLIEFLSTFLAIGKEDVPENSILREFIGRSSFNY